MENLDQFRKETKEWLEENCPPEMRKPMGPGDVVWGGRNCKFPHPDAKLWLERMGEKGWTCPTWPKEYGGGGLSFDENKILQEELMAIRARPALSSFGIWMLGPALLEFASEEQKKKYIPEIVKGEIRWCQGYSEPGSGSDLASLKTKAEDFFARFKGKITYKGSGALPMSGTISQFTKGNYMLAGDSAGMVLPSNGAGITTAMIGGRVAGQAIANHINHGYSLDEYEKNWDKQMGKMMKYSKRGIKWGEIMFNSPDWLVDASFNSLSKPFIWRAVNCRPVLGIY